MIDGKRVNATHVEWLSGIRLDAWWTRVWVVQEFGLAKELVFQFRDKYFDVQVVKKFTGGRFCDLFSDLRGLKPGLPTEHLQKGFNALVGPVTTLLRHRGFHHPGPDPGFISDLSTAYLIDILFEIRARPVTNPKDRIFGNLALINRILGASLIEPDYTKELGDIFMLFTIELIKKSRSLT